MRVRVLGLLLSGLLSLGCGASGVVSTAMHGDLSSLQREVKASRERGELDPDTVEDLARAVAGREVRSATGTAAVERIRDVRVCAQPLLPVLEDRAGQADDAAAEATLTLLELHRRDPAELVARHRDASSGAWRAVAARATTDPSYGPLRRRLFADPDERVRRAALHAALAARRGDDLEALLEAARLDPDPLSRSIATRATGAIGGERAVLALKDHFARADEPTRISILDAWAMPGSLSTGGQRELLTVAETMRGTLAITAADALTRSGGAPGAVGTAVLIREVGDGSEAERRFALRLVPLSDPDALAAVQKAAKGQDKEVRVVALARLAGVEGHKKDALTGLRELAKKDDDLGLQARAALAAAGDRGVTPQLTALLAAQKAKTRLTAAKGLLDLGEYAQAATALADDDPGVRTAMACAVLTKRR